MQLTTKQASQLKHAYQEIREVLAAVGILDAEQKAPTDPQWLRDTARQWGLLSDLRDQHDGDAGSEEWARLGRQHGYDPRGLGGFFTGSQPLMGSQGARRVLTTHGQRFIDRWRADFEG